MKISNWCRKLAAALVAGGVISVAPSFACGQSLGSNLVVNSGFETVDLAVTGGYGGPKILNWTGPNLFAYSHDGSSSSAGVVPNYADGAALAGGGHWYFTSNNTNNPPTSDIRAAGVFFQDINVSGGTVGPAIASGSARYRLQAFMTSYLNDADVGNVHLDFRNNVGGSLGVVLLTDSDPGPNNVWSLNASEGGIPSATASMRVSLFGTPVTGGADGFIDNVSLVVSRPGDYNGNGTVDAADYTVWRNTVGSATDKRADGTGPSGVPDGVVNRLDYNFWKLHYGEHNGSGAASLASAVPEPSSLVLLCVAAGAVFSFHTGRNRND